MDQLKSGLAVRVRLSSKNPGVPLEGAVYLAFQQAARHSAAGMPLGHDATHPVRCGQVIHKRGATWCKSCG